MKNLWKHGHRCAECGAADLKSCQYALMLVEGREAQLTEKMRAATIDGVVLLCMKCRRRCLPPGGQVNRVQ